ncbi:unnamed protein product [Closterium sp. NIES-54]
MRPRAAPRCLSLVRPGLFRPVSARPGPSRPLCRLSSARRRPSLARSPRVAASAQQLPSRGLYPAAALSWPYPTAAPVAALPYCRPCCGPVFAARRGLCPTAAPVAALHCCRPGRGPDLNSQLRLCPAPAPAEPRRPTEPRCTAEPRCPSACTTSAATTAAAATATTAATTATAATAAMASPTVLTFDAEGRAVDFEVWVDDLQLFLQCDSRDGVSPFDHTSDVSTAPAATAESTVRSQWTTRDSVARLAVRCHLPPAERAHFG